MLDSTTPLSEFRSVWSELSTSRLFFADIRLCPPSVRIFAAIGFAKEKTFLFQSINSIIALIAQGICVAFCDKVGLAMGKGN